jgi:inosine/xanthosine triphosphate pyrophosphatase family protein
MGKRIIISESERLEILEKYDKNRPIFTTSNKFKSQEFKKYLPSVKIKKGKDLDEVMGTKEDVIIYKSLDAGEGYLVEDTILIVNGEEIVDIRWKADELEEGDKATWVVSLGYNDGENISVYRGSINGFISGSRQGEGFGSKFYPEGQDKPMDYIENNIHYYSARKIAIENFKNKRPLYVVKISDIPPWSGKYQH